MMDVKVRIDIEKAQTLFYIYRLVSPIGYADRLFVEIDNDTPDHQDAVRPGLFASSEDALIYSIQSTYGFRTDDEWLEWFRIRACYVYRLNLDDNSKLEAAMKSITV